MRRRLWICQSRFALYSAEKVVHAMTTRQQSSIVKDIIMNTLLSTNKTSIIDFIPRSSRMCPSPKANLPDGWLFQSMSQCKIDLLMAFWLLLWEGLLAMWNLPALTFQWLGVVFVLWGPQNSTLKGWLFWFLLSNLKVKLFHFSVLQKKNKIK